MTNGIYIFKLTIENTLMIKKIFFLVNCILFSICSPAMAAVQTHESLHAAALSFLQQETQNIKDSKITMRPLDKRLRLNQCSIPLHAFWPLANKKYGSTTIGIRCDGNKPWKIYVGAHIHIYKNVWVSNYALNRNQIISSQDINMEKRDITKLSSGYLLANHPIIGMQIKRNVPANQILTNVMLDSQKIIKRGDRITIVAKYNNIEVHAKGVALSDGSKGDRIRVKNSSSKREIEAYVSDKHRVLLNL